jgi:hypothetical protein
VIRWPLLVAGAGVVVGIVVFWFAPLLGAIIVIGAVGGLLVALVPSVTERIASWLSGAGFRRRHWTK